MTSDAEPLSDAEFMGLDYVVISDARKIQADGRYHRARVCELEAERDKLISDLEGPMDARLARVEAERDELRQQLAEGGAAVMSDAEPMSASRRAELIALRDIDEANGLLPHYRRYRRTHPEMPQEITEENVVGRDDLLTELHRVEGERDKLISDLEGPMDARLAALEAECDHLRGKIDECEAALLECKHEDEEITKLRRQVEAARTAHCPAVERTGELCVHCLAALAPQAGEVGS